MKSIKKKANEAYPALEGDLYCTSENLVRRESFVVGANYVLDAIEEFLNLYGVWCMSSSARAYLKDMIEQLKK